MRFQKYYKYLDDGEKRLYIKKYLCDYKKGWERTIKDLAWLFFEKYKVLINENVCCLFISSKYKKNPKLKDFIKNYQMS